MVSQQTNIHKKIYIEKLVHEFLIYLDWHSRHKNEIVYIWIDTSTNIKTLFSRLQARIRV